MISKSFFILRAQPQELNAIWKEFLRDVDGRENWSIIFVT